MMSFRKLYDECFVKYCLLRGALFKAYCKARFSGRVSIGERLMIYGPYPFFRVTGVGRIVIGRDCTLISSTKYNHAGILKPVSIISRNGVIKIGDNVGVSGASIFSDMSVSIGNDVMIGANSFIFDSDFHSLNAFDRVREARGFLDDSSIKRGPVSVGRGAFIGLNCLVLRGVVLGEEAVVGAGTVVSKDVPAGYVCVGSGCRVIGGNR